VLEREARPGGLVRTHRLGDAWFDHVLHLLHLADPEVEAFLAGIPDLHLSPCPPRAEVVTASGAARFPIQLHVGDLGPRLAARIVAEVEALEAAGHPPEPAKDYAELLTRSFGPTLRDLFFGPYNTKLWRRPLERMAPEGQTWNLHLPSAAELRAGAGPHAASRGGYNARGLYPRPPAGAPLRGMEMLARGIASFVADLRLEHEITEVDLDRRLVTVRTPGGSDRLGWGEACFSTLPLPRLAAMTTGLPAELRRAATALPFQRIRSVALLVEGERPGLGHWRYYPEPHLVFHRLSFLHEFDPLLAPPGQWPLLAEISEDGAAPPEPAASLLERAETDARVAGVIAPGDRVVARDVFLADPGYIVFVPGVRGVVEACREVFVQAGIRLGGRYGAWEYGSMAQAIAAGLGFARMPAVA
jgi:protoporphyrinogen oxidase